MSQPAKHTDVRYTWADYQTWPDGERWEIIGGMAHAMAPGPTDRHQLVSGGLFLQFGNYLRGKPCRVLTAPMDVKLSDHDVVQPDLLVVCDPQQFKGTHIEGAPKLVLEVVSPSSVCRDRLEKLRLYERAGVEEYWIVTPYPALVEIFRLESGQYHLHAGGTQVDTLRSIAFPGLEITLAEVFDVPYSTEEKGFFAVKESPSPYGTGAGT